MKIPIIKKIYITFIFVFFVANCFCQQRKESMEVASLSTFCKTWGLLKYYDKKTNIDFDQLFFANYWRFKTSKGKKEFNENMIRVFDTLRLKIVINNGIISKESLDKIYQSRAWKEINDTNVYTIKPDFNWIMSDTLLDNTNKARILRVLEDYKPSKRSRYVTSKMISHEHSFKEKVYPINYDSIREEYKVLSLFRYWNIIHYFFSYKKLMDENWDSVLVGAIPWFADTNQYYYHYFGRLIAKIDDSHGFWEFPKTKHSKKATNNITFYSARKMAPLCYKIIENNFIISKILDEVIIDKGDIKIGDTIISVNSYQFSNLIDWYKNEFANSTTQALNNRFENYIPQNIYDTGFVVRVMRGQDTSSYYIGKGISYNEYRKFIYPKDTLHYYPVSKDIGYVNLSTLRGKEVSKSLKKFKHHKSIIFDMRGYPNNWRLLFLPRYFSHVSVPVASFEYADKKFPGAFKKYHKPETYFVKIPVLRKSYQGNVVVLINADAMSAAETMCMIFKAYAKNVTFIGEPTVGANGDVTTFNLPDGSRTSFSSINWHFPNGTRLQRIGIQPDILVKPTPESLKTGGDIILEKAIEYLNTK